MLTRCLNDRMIKSFWFWDSFLVYAMVLGIFTVCVYLLTVTIGGNKHFQAIIGFASSSIEALLGVPQFWLNFKRKNTSGLS